MAEYATPVIEAVKLVGPTIWKYVKFQTSPNSYVGECGIAKERLQNRLQDIETKMQSQMMGVGKNSRHEVDDWRKRARDAIALTDEVRLNRGGCFCNIRRAKHFDDRTQEMRSIYDEGQTYTRADAVLVCDDHSVIQNHLMTVFQNDYVSLQHRKKDIELALKKQIRFGKIVREEVNGWLEKARKKLETAHDEFNQGGGLSPPRQVDLLNVKIRELNVLLEEGLHYIYNDVILVNDDPLATRGVPLYAEKCYGRDTALIEIPKYLKGDIIKRVAVWGMGGIGKTTLMKHIHNQFLNEAQFDKVIWITVSSKLDIFQIQNEVVEQMDEEVLKEKDASRRAGKMSVLLQRGSYLLILDDVWEAFSDEDVGIPSEFRGLKIVVTTRSANVARQISCDVIIKLEPLSPEKALQLFLDKAGKVVLSDDGNIKPNLEAALMKIVEECDGLPLAIVTVASTMKGMTDDQYSWVKALKQLRKGTSVVEGEKDPKNMLKFSYDHLKDEQVQHCFLYCSLFPEDFEIPKEQLIEYWIEEGLIDQMDTRHEMICEGHVILRKLEDNCLLESIDKYGDEDVVKMHDLIRDLALYITSKSPRFLVKARASEEELHKEEAWPENVEKVSLMMNYDSMKEIPLANMHLEYNMLTTLLMPNNSIVTIPEPLFMHTPGLRILDLSWNKELRCLPDSISHLEKLTTLLLEACFNLKKVPSLSKCQALTKLDLEYSGIEEVSDGIEMLVNLKCLNLQWTRLKLPEGMISKLSNLEHLLIKDTKIRIEDVVTLRKLEYLEAVGIMVERVEEMSILLGFMQEQMERFTSFTLQVEAPLLELTLERDLTTIIADMLHNDGKRFCHLRSDDVGDGDCDLKCLNRILVNQALRLRFLNIKFSDNVDCVFGRGFNPLQTLEELTLNGLSNLKSVFDETALGLSAPPSSSQSFLPLKSIDIERCPELKMLFSPALLCGYLQNLESISVSFCGGIEEIISFTSEEEEDQIEEKLTLPKLKRLILKDLPKLKSICSSSSVLICDSLEVLEIRECEGLNKIPLSFPQLGDAQPSSTPSL